MEYQRVCSVDGEGKPVNKGTFIPYGSDPFKVIKDKNKPHYLSVFIYNDEHKKKYDETHSISGFTDVVTDKLYWDFDSKNNLDKAKSDAQEMCTRLIQHGIDKDDILLCFSGAKGFSVEVKVDKRLKPEEIKIIAAKMAEGLETFDGSIYDASRVFRIPFTKHQDTGLYKFPLSFEELNENTIDGIKSAASEMPPSQVIPNKKQIELPESILELKRTDTKDRATTATIVDAADLDFKHKPKGFSNCKFAIMNGFFPDGNRYHSMMVLAATCRANGFPKESAYNLCKAAIRLQSQRYGSSPFSKEELWTQVIEGTYGSKWNGGQYTCKTDPTLKKICESLGHHKCKIDSESLTVKSEEVFSLFKNYAINFDKNALNSGIKPLDDKVKFLVGSSVGILAPPGVGKTSFAFSLLNHNSKQGIPSIFFSYDMHHSLTYLRLCQKHFGLEQDALFKLIRENSPKVEEIMETIKEEYKNVQFCFKNGQTSEDIDRTIMETEDKIGAKIRLAVVDYSELVVAETSDPTQASAQVAQKMRQIANERELCTVSLLQPSKLYSNPSEEAATYQAAKGSGAIAQSLTLMLGLSRPGFSPRRPEEDRFFTVSALKNRMGSLFSLDLSWNGLRGEIGELSYEDENELKAIRERKKAEKAEQDSY